MHLTQLPSVIKSTLEKAGFVAAEFNHELCEPGHLLIGILEMPPLRDNVARKVLEDHHVTIDRLRKIVARRYPWNSDQNVAHIDSLSTETMDVLLKAEEIAQRDRNHLALMRLDHLLIALIEQDPVIAVIFVDLGVFPQDILRRLTYELAG